jgi:GNAT superfamily N-acetyltransferase
VTAADTASDVTDVDLASMFGAMVRRSAWRLASSWQPVEGGWSARTDSLPLVWTLNSLHLDACASVEVLERLAARYQGDLSYRHALVDGSVDAEVETELIAGGWSVERDCVMAMNAMPPDLVRADVVIAEVIDLSEGELLELMEAWLLEEQPLLDAERIGQVLEFCRREATAWTERRLGVRGATGEPLGVARLRIRDHVAWIEDVYVTRSARGAGVGRAIVTEAVRASFAGGCTTVVLAADADDWPRHLYATIGFREVGTRRIFHREVDGAPTPVRGPGSWA